MADTGAVRRLARAAVFASLFAVTSGVVHAQTTLTATQLRQAAADALRSGQPSLAAGYAEALLERDARDLDARLIKARALRDLGDTQKARVAARKAWQQSQTNEEKYATALITAQVLSSAGRRTRAQLWLRRAVQHAPNDLLAARAKRDFRYVKQRNPWQTYLSFTLAPNSNINNGSARERSELNYAISKLFGLPIEFDLSAAAQALSGIEIGGSLRTRYRFRQTPTTAQDLKLALSYRTFALSGSSKAAAPSLSGADFAFGSFSLGYGYRMLNFDRRGEFSFDAEAGQTWYGGARYASFLRSSIEQSIKTSATQKYRFAADLERQWGQATPDLDSIGLRAGLTQQFQNGNQGYFAIAAKKTHSIDKTVEYGELELRGTVALRKPIFGAAIQVGLGAAYRDYDVSLHSANGRQDKKIFADVTAVFREVDYYGFNPSVTVSASHTDSNIGLYDVNRFGVSLGVRSAF